LQPKRGNPEGTSGTASLEDAVPPFSPGQKSPLMSPGAATTSCAQVVP